MYSYSSWKNETGWNSFWIEGHRAFIVVLYEKATNVSYKIILYSFFIFQQWIWCNFRILNIEYEYNALVIIFKFSIRFSIIMNSHLLINIELYQTGFFFKLTISYSVFLIVYPFLQTQDK